MRLINNVRNRPSIPAARSDDRQLCVLNSRVDSSIKAVRWLRRRLSSCRFEKRFFMDVRKGEKKSSRHKQEWLGRHFGVRPDSGQQSRKQSVPGSYSFDAWEANRSSAKTQPDRCFLRMSISTSSVVSRVDWKACA